MTTLVATFIRKAASFITILYCTAALVACDPADRLMAKQFGCDLLGTLIKGIATALKASPAAPASLAGDLLGVSASAGCKAIFADDTESVGSPSAKRGRRGGRIRPIPLHRLADELVGNGYGRRGLFDVLPGLKSGEHVKLRS